MTELVYTSNPGVVFEGSNSPKQASSIEDFPIEVLHLIVTFVYANNVLISFSKHLEWFAKLFMLTNKTFYYLGLRHLVNYCRFSCPQTFDLFNRRFGRKAVPKGLDAIGIALSDEDSVSVDANSVSEPCSVYNYINVLDFQEFSSIGLGRTNRNNIEIQMVTNKTILAFLKKASRLKEILLSENVQNDMSVEILEMIFFKLQYLQAVDFCGCSGNVFLSCFKQVLEQPGAFENPCTNLKYLSFHDCIDIPNLFFKKLFLLLVNVEKLDLFHTQITGEGLDSLDGSKLTHLSLGCCYKLDKRHLVSFFAKKEPYNNCENLKWLNLETENADDMLERELLMVLRFISQSSQEHTKANFKLQYLNVNGRRVTNQVLLFIKETFIFLKSLHIKDCTVSTEDLIKFMSPPEELAPKQMDAINSRVSTMLHLNDYFNSNNVPELSKELYQEILEDTEVYQQLRFIDVRGNPNVNNYWSLNNPNLIECCPSLLAWEFDLRPLENSPNQRFNYYSSFYSLYNSGKSSEEFFWKIFDTNERRSWLYKLRLYNKQNLKYLNYDFNFDRDYHPKKIVKQRSSSSAALLGEEFTNGDQDLDYEILTEDPNYVPNATRYDIETGKKIEPKLIFYPFLKYASRKIDISNGPFYSGLEVFYKIWPVKFSERGIYRYYALSV